MLLRSNADSLTVPSHLDSDHEERENEDDDDDAAAAAANHSQSQSPLGGGKINDLISKLKTRISMDRGNPSGSGSSSGRHSRSFKRNRDSVIGWKRINNGRGDEEDPPSSSSPSSRRRIHHHHHHHSGMEADLDGQTGMEALGDPPEWALLLIGCLLGLATGLCVAAFNRGVHVIHEWAWAGTPNEGAAWLRLQRLADTWHRILLIPVTGGVIVGMMHGLLEILEQINPPSNSNSSQRQGLDVLGGFFPIIKAVQAAVTLGTGCSLGPEGPSVDIGKS